MSFINDNAKEFFKDVIVKIQLSIIMMLWAFVLVTFFGLLVKWGFIMMNWALPLDKIMRL